MEHQVNHQHNHHAHHLSNKHDEIEIPIKKKLRRSAGWRWSLILIIFGGLGYIGYFLGNRSLAPKNIDNPPVSIPLVVKPKPTDPGQATLKGTVINAINEQPISNAKVSVGDLSTTTSDNGTFSLEKAVQSDQVTISADGYNDATVGRSLTDKIALTPNGLIVLVSNKDGKKGLFTSTYAGKAVKPLIERVDDTEDYQPIVSPHDRYVAFFSTRDKRKNKYDNYEPALYLVKIDGSGLVKISDFFDINSVSWSPQGTYLAWVGRETGDTSDSKLAIRDIDSGSTVYNGNAGDTIGSYTYSLDDKNLAFSVSNNDGSRRGLYIVSGNGINPKKVADTVSYAMSFNQDSNLKFTNYTDKQHYMVWFHDSGVVKEVEKNDNQRSGMFSPDGQWVAYIDNRDGKSNVFISHPDKSAERQVTKIDTATGSIRFTPDGNYLTFSVVRPGESARYIVATSGEGNAKKIIDEYPASNSYGQGM